MGPQVAAGRNTVWLATAPEPGGIPALPAGVGGAAEQAAARSDTIDTIDTSDIRPPALAPRARPDGRGRATIDILASIAIGSHARASGGSADGRQHPAGG